MKKKVKLKKKPIRATRKKPSTVRKTLHARPTQEPLASSETSRERILEVAAKLFAEKGIHGVSVREIAKASGANLSLISYHFGGKENLYLSIFQNHATEVGGALMGVLTSPLPKPFTRADFTDRIRRILTAIVENRLRTPEMAKLIMHERLHGMTHCRPVFNQAFARLSSVMVNLLEEAKEAGFVRPDLNIRSYYLTMFESVWGYFALYDCQVDLWEDAYRPPRQKAEYIEFLVRLYTEGIFK